MKRWAEVGSAEFAALHKPAFPELVEELSCFLKLRVSPKEKCSPSTSSGKAGLGASLIKVSHLN
jgi:hypothetical protein